MAASVGKVPSSQVVQKRPNEVGIRELTALSQCGQMLSALRRHKNTNLSFSVNAEYIKNEVLKMCF